LSINVHQSVNIPVLPTASTPPRQETFSAPGETCQTGATNTPGSKKGVKPGGQKGGQKRVKKGSKNAIFSKNHQKALRIRGVFSCFSRFFTFFFDFCMFSCRICVSKKGRFLHVCFYLSHVFRVENPFWTRPIRARDFFRVFYFREKKGGVFFGVFRRCKKTPFFTPFLGVFFGCFLGVFS
jgi:hypothetical protein